MTPENGDLILDTEEAINTETFGVDLTNNIIRGKIDGLESIKQSIYLMLSIEADQYIIYPYTYGITTLDLIGKPSYYVIAVLPERITKSLLLDNRILDVSDFEFEVHKNKIGVKFVVHTIFGEVDGQTEVTY